MKISLIAFTSLALLASACTIETSDPGSTSHGTGGGEGTSDPEAAQGCVRDRDIEANETWSPAVCPDGYVIKSDIGVRGTGVELKLEPGTVVKHEQGAGLSVYGGASLIAKGTVEKPIAFKGWQSAPGIQENRTTIIQFKRTLNIR